MPLLGPPDPGDPARVEVIWQQQRAAGPAAGAVVNEVSRTRDQLHPTPDHAGDQVQLVALPPVAQGQGCAWWAGPADAFAGVGKFSSTGRPLAPAQIGRFFQRLGSSGKLLGSYQAWVAA